MFTVNARAAGRKLIKTLVSLTTNPYAYIATSVVLFSSLLYKPLLFGIAEVTNVIWILTTFICIVILPIIVFLTDIDLWWRNEFRVAKAACFLAAISLFVYSLVLKGIDGIVGLRPVVFDLVKSFTDKNFYVATSLFLYCMGLYLKVYNAEQKNIVDTRSDLGRKLSNMYLLNSPIQDKFGLNYWTVESAYQAAKTEDREQRLEIASSLLVDPKWAGLPAKQLGSKVDLTEGFNKKRIQLMKMLLVEKYKDPYFQSALLSTKDLLIVEIDRKNRDSFWAVNSRLQGENTLGKILMEIRSSLLTTSQPPSNSHGCSN